LSEAEELAVYLYLKRLNSIRMLVRLSVVTSCTNAILKYNHEFGSPISSNNPPLTIGSTWTPCFLEQYSEFHIHKQKILDHDRKKVHNPKDLRS
ncbi:hypothetical protein L873DRAFT_1856325, partial [Choiromyces venosus 120613-1]